jgi:hypothetical protein
MTAGQTDATTMILLSNPANGYNEFVGQGSGGLFRRETMGLDKEAL